MNSPNDHIEINLIHGLNTLIVRCIDLKNL